MSEAEMVAFALEAQRQMFIESVLKFIVVVSAILAIGSGIIIWWEGYVHDLETESRRAEKERQREGD